MGAIEGTQAVTLASNAIAETLETAKDYSIGFHSVGSLVLNAIAGFLKLKMFLAFLLFVALVITLTWCVDIAHVCTAIFLLPCCIIGPVQLIFNLLLLIESYLLIFGGYVGNPYLLALLDNCYVFRPVFLLIYTIHMNYTPSAYFTIRTNYARYKKLDRNISFVNKRIGVISAAVLTVYIMYGFPPCLLYCFNALVMCGGMMIDLSLSTNIKRQSLPDEIGNMIRVFWYMSLILYVASLGIYLFTFTFDMMSLTYFAAVALSFFQFLVNAYRFTFILTDDSMI